MEKGANSVGGRPTYDGKGAKFSRGGVAGKSEQRQDSNVSFFLNREQRVPILHLAS